MAQVPVKKKAKLSAARAQAKPETHSESESELSESEKLSLEEDSNSDGDEIDNEEEEDEEDQEEVDSDGSSGSGSSSSSSNEESEEEENDSSTREPKDDGFGTAMSAILGSKIKSHSASNPILIRNKRPAKEIEEAREDRKVRKALRAERLQHKDKARVRDVIPKDPEEAGDVLANEKRLRKTAQRGVIKLLNAINTAQNAALQGLSGSGIPDKRAAESSVELSKEKFLDMIRMG